jgi:type IV secretory pathway VirB9-like protein
MLPLLAMAMVPLTAKHIEVSPDRIASIQTKIGWVSEVDFPKNRTIISFRVGDEGFWDVSKHGNVLFVRPMDVPQIGGGKKTNISVSLDSGSYTFAVEEVSKTNGSPDLKVIADMGAEETNAAPLVRSELLEAAKAENAALRVQVEALGKNANQSCEDSLQRELNSLRGDYELYDKKGKPDFQPVILHDDRFTYIFLEDVQELPTVMAIRDGKPDKVQVLFQAGKYTMPYIKEGVVIVGKQSIKFKRREK